MAPPVLADIINVPGDFLCIQEAIDAAVDGDEVVVADGTYTGACNKNLDFQAKAITLRSESGNRELCIIDCEFDGRFATFGAGDTAVVQSLTIRNGDAAGASGGAALLNAGSSTSFIDCVFQNCHADIHGGALASNNSSVTINGCAFRNNTADVFGGAIRTSGASVALVGTEFDENEAGNRGGAASIRGGEVMVSGCIFKNNIAGVAGGGLRFPGSSTPQVENVVFLNNTAWFGGGVEVEPGNSPEFVNCLFAGNSATGGGGNPGQGGGIDIFGPGATPTMVNCTFSDNSSADFGGAVGVECDADLQLVNCVLWGNQAPTGAEIRISYPGEKGGTVTVSYSDVAGGEAGVSIGKGGILNWGDGNIDRDPLFVDPDGPDDDPDTYEDNNYRLGAGSSAIDAADNTSVPKGIDTDLDDNPRFIDDPTTKDTGLGDCPIVDMGSYEFQEGIADCCQWDLDGGGFVGAGDLLLLLADWGNPYGASDLLALLADWGACP